MRKKDTKPRDFFIQLGKPTKLCTFLFFMLVSVLFLASFGSTFEYVVALVFYMIGFLVLVQLSRRYRLVDGIGIRAGRWYLVSANSKCFVRLMGNSIVLPGILLMHFINFSKDKINIMISQDMTPNPQAFRTLARNAKLNSRFSNN